MAFGQVGRSSQKCLADHSNNHHHLYHHHHFQHSLDSAEEQRELEEHIKSLGLGDQVKNGSYVVAHDILTPFFSSHDFDEFLTFFKTHGTSALLDKRQRFG